jgi:hypothetical protein
VSWVNQERNGICCSGVELPIQRWVNITAQRYSGSLLLTDIEVESSARKHLLKQCS